MEDCLGCSYLKKYALFFECIYKRVSIKNTTQRCHNYTTSEVEGFECPDCGYEFSDDLDEYQEHYLEEHAEIPEPIEVLIKPTINSWSE